MVCVRAMRIQASARESTVQTEPKVHYCIGFIARTALALPPDSPQLSPLHQATPRLVCQARLGRVRWMS